MPWECAICVSAIADTVVPLEVQDDTGSRIVAACHTCYRDRTTRCACCQSFIINPTRPATSDGRRICNECMDHHYTCTSCQSLRHTDDVREYEGNSMCEPCFTRDFVSCRECGDVARRRTERAAEQPTDDENGEPLTESERREGEYCGRCAGRHVIKSHSYKPRPKFRGEGPRFFGVELEVECGDTEPGSVAAEIVNRTGGGLVYAKHDGSLMRGFEVVSHPFSWGWLQSGGRDHWLKILKRLRQMGCRSFDTNTCGMHVHVSRDAFSPTDLVRLQRLAHSNPRLILKLSRRKANNLYQWAQPRDTNFSEQVELASGRRDEKRNRYAAINVTGKTVEIRIFRGTCDDDGFLANLETVQSLVEFSKRPSSLFPKAESYLGYIKENAKQYPNLVSTILKGAV